MIVDCLGRLKDHQLGRRKKLVFMQQFNTIVDNRLVFLEILVVTLPVGKRDLVAYHHQLYL